MTLFREQSRWPGRQEMSRRRGRRGLGERPEYRALRAETPGAARKPFRYMGLRRYEKSS